MRMGRASRASTEERDEDGGAEVRMIMIIMVKTVMVMVGCDGCYFFCCRSRLELWMKRAFKEHLRFGPDFQLI